MKTGMRRTVHGSLALLASLALLVHPTPCVSQTAIHVVATSALELLTALASWGQVGPNGTVITDVLLEILPPADNPVVNLTGVSVAPGPPQVEQGTLNVMGPWDSLVLLDLDRKSFATASQGGTASLTASNVVAVNSCMYPFTIREGQTMFQNTVVIFFGFSVQQRSVWNSSIIVNPSEVAMMKYSAALVDADQIPDIQDYAEVYTKALGLGAQFTVNGVTECSITFQHLTLATLVLSNLTVSSYPCYSAADPWLEAAGGLPWPQSCPFAPFPVRPLTPEEYYQDYDQVPLWTVTTASQLPHALLEMSSRRQSPMRTDWPALLMMRASAMLGTPSFNNASKGSSIIPASPLVLPGTTLLMGRFGHLTSSPGVVLFTLDLNATTTPLFHLPPVKPLPTSMGPSAMAQASTLIIRKLIVRGLGTAALGGANASGDGTLQSALPLWAVSRGCDACSVQLERCTLIVPQTDYAALLAAALRGAAWQSGARTTAPLIRGITELVASGVVNNGEITSDAPALLLVSYTGWGVRAMRVTVAPEQPLGLCYPLPDYEYTLPEGCEGSGSVMKGAGSSQPALRLGLGVGLGVGLGLLLLLLGSAAFLKARHLRANIMSFSESNAGGILPGNCTGPKPVSNPSTLGSNLLQGDVTYQGSHGSKSVEILIMGCDPSVRGDSRKLPTILDFTRARAGCTSSPSAQGSGVDDSAAAAGEAKGAQGAHKQGRGGRHGNSAPSKEEMRAAVMAASEALNVGHADKLTLTGILGKGSYGIVYAGVWKGLDVAVKTVLFSSAPGSLPSTPVGRTGNDNGGASQHHSTRYEQAIKEAAVCTSLAHRNVVSTYRYDFKVMTTRNEAGQLLEVDVGSNASANACDFKLYLIQERCSASLADAMDAHVLTRPLGPFSVLQVKMLLLLDIARGVEYLHASNIIHGDLKPDNVLLKDDKASELGLVAKLTDFGVAMAMTPGATHVSNYCAGTSFYMAPEVAAQSQLTRASDVYSFGVILWSLLCDDDPWVELPDGGFGAHPVFPEIPPTVRLEGPAATELKALMTSCLARESRTRPSAAEVMRSLQEVYVMTQQQPAQQPL